MSETARLDLNFGASGGGLFLGQGWSIEPGTAWAIGPMSGMTLPIPRRAPARETPGHATMPNETPHNEVLGDIVLRFTVKAVVVPPKRRAQRLTLRVGEWLVGAFVLTSPRDIEVRIPALLLEGLDQLDLRLDHPDAITPLELLGVDDRRELAIEFMAGEMLWEAGPAPLPASPMAAFPGARVPALPVRPPRTLIFCTSHATTPERWNIRYGAWLKAMLRGGLLHDQILMIDDGSPLLPRWQGVDIVLDAPGARSGARAAIYRFHDNLGRREDGYFPGWYRSFGFAGTYAERCGFDKIIHVESDAFLISPRIHTYFNERSSGWTALWCPRHTIPESGIQIMAGREIADYRAFTARPYPVLGHTVIENVMPFTRVEKHFTGDRYGEIGETIPRDADYAMQLRFDLYADPDYLWWLK